MYFIEIKLDLFLSSIYFALCGGGDSNRQFFKMHFSNYHPCDLHFVGYNAMTKTPMVFQMDCKVSTQRLFLGLHFIIS